MKVTVDFLTRQTMDGDCVETRFTAIGLLEETEAGLCLRYVEPPDGDPEETSGAAVRVMAVGERVSVERQSSTIHSRMLMEAGCCHPCRYDTLYGALDMQIRCDTVTNELTPRGGRITAQYRVDTPGAEAFENTMEITVKEVSE